MSPSATDPYLTGARPAYGSRLASWTGSCRHVSRPPCDSPAQHAVFRASPDGGAQTDAAREYENLLRQAQSQQPEALQAFAAERREELTLDFLLWLADR